MPHTKGENPEWHRASTPFAVDLHGVVHATDGEYAVGGGGTLAADRGSGWEVVLSSGPSGEGSTLRAIAATDGGRRVWFAGASGALGMYDTKTERKYDYSYDGDATTSWQEIAVSGTAEDERALLANGSGTIVSFEVEGVEIAFSEPTQPGQGATISALTSTSNGVGYAVDAAGQAYRANPRGWEKMPQVNGQVGLNDIYADAVGRLYVAAGDGRLYRYEEVEESWTPIDVARSALLAVDVFQDHIYALASGGNIYWRTVDGDTRWQRVEAPTGNNLLSLALGYPDVAVGKSGVVVERPPERKPEQEHPEDPKTKPRDPDPLPACELLVEELLTRLSVEDLLELRERVGCENELGAEIASLLEGEGGEAVRLEELLDGEAELILPVEADVVEERVGGCDVGGHHHHHGRRCRGDGHHHGRRCHGGGHRHERVEQGHEDLLVELERLVERR